MQLMRTVVSAEDLDTTPLRLSLKYVTFDMISCSEFSLLACCVIDNYSSTLGKSPT